MDDSISSKALRAQNYSQGVNCQSKLNFGKIAFFHALKQGTYQLGREGGKSQNAHVIIRGGIQMLTEGVKKCQKSVHVISGRPLTQLLCGFRIELATGSLKSFPILSLEK